MQCQRCYAWLPTGTYFCPVCGAESPLALNDPHRALYTVAALLWLGLDLLRDKLKEERARKIMNGIEEMYHAYQAGNYGQAFQIERSLSVPRSYSEAIHLRYALILGQAQCATGDYKGARGNLLAALASMVQLDAPATSIAIGYFLVAEACAKELRLVPSGNVPLAQFGIDCMNETIKRTRPEAQFYTLRAVFYAGTGRYKHMQQDARLALSLDPQNQAAKVLLSAADQAS